MSGGDRGVHWPLWRIRLTVADLELAPMTEADLPEVLAALPDDLELDPAATRYDGLPEQDQRRVVVQQEYWRRWGTWSPQAWRLGCCVRRGGTVLGMQELEGNDFPTVRTVDTSSWLTAAERGRGTGKAMRRAVLTLAFEGLGAEAAVTSAWHDNHGSLGVSRSLGYQPNGVSRMLREGTGAPDTLVHLRMTREQWQASGGAVGVRLAGVDAGKPFFGL